MKKCKQVLSIFLAVIMLVAAVPVMNIGLKASAITGSEFDSKLSDFKSDCYGHGSHYNNNEPNILGSQCFGYANYIARYVFGSFPSSMASGSPVRDGWTISYGASALDNLHVGDIIRYKSPSYNHSVFVTGISGDTVYFTDANSDGNNTVKFNRSYDLSFFRDRIAMTCSDSGKLGWVGHYKDWDDDPEPVDLGEQFYALILNTKYRKPISLNTDTNRITLETEKNVPYQKWRFTRQDDLAYRIESCANGKVLEMTNGVRENRTQLTAHDDWWGGYYQQWYFIPQGDGYVMQSKHYTSENWVMDLRGSSNADGSVIQIYQRNDNYADDETWSVYKIDDYSNSSNVKTDKSIYPLGADVKLSWNYCVGATSYSLTIWKAGEWRNGVWKDAYSIDTIRIDKATTSYTYRPTEDGGYTFMLKAVDAEEVSSVSRIIVNPQAIDLGEDFFAEIVNTSTNRIIGNFDNNVQASSNEENDPRLIWHFLQNGDGSYNVYNTYSGALLTAENGGTTSGDNIICQSNHVGASQHWVITHRNGVDCLVSSSGNRFMSLEGGSPEPGTNVKLWTDNGTAGSAAQGFSVVKVTDYARPEAPDAPELSISSLGSQDTDTVFTWTASPLKSAKYDNRAYNLRIWQGSELGVNGTEYTHVVNMTDTTCSVRLPKGQYTAYLTAQNTKYHWFSTPSNSVTFTIGNHTHNWTLNSTEAATCIATGTKTFTCSCGASYTETISIDFSNHVNTTNVAATASTCSVRGYSAGVYCNDCKRFISGHEAQSLAPNNHVNTTNVAATRSTCTVKGYSAGVYCNDCKQYISGHVEQPLAAHQTTVVNAREATYDANGYTGDTYCTVCKQTLSYGSSIPKLTKPEDPTNPTNPTQPTNPTPQPTQPQQQPSGSCKYCGQNHTGFSGVLIGFFHSILALFGLRK